MTENFEHTHEGFSGFWNTENGADISVFNGVKKGIVDDDLKVLKNTIEVPTLLIELGNDLNNFGVICRGHGLYEEFNFVG